REAQYVGRCESESRGLVALTISDRLSKEGVPLSMQILQVFQAISRFPGRIFHSKSSMFAFISLALLVMALTYRARVQWAANNGAGSAGSNHSAPYQIAVYY